jgi:hypothetical protein
MSRLWTFTLLVSSAVFALIGLAMVVRGAEHGWPGFLFFGVCAAVFTWQLWPGLLNDRPPEAPELMLQRFPGPVVLRFQRRKTLFLLVVCAIFAALMLRMMLTEPPPGIFVAAIIWFGIIGMAACLPPGLYIAIWGATLRLDRDGFRVSQLWHNHHTRWAETGPFVVSDVSILFSPHSMTKVVYDDIANSDSTIGALNTSLSGRNNALPDTYGYSPDDLATLMNGWRERALGQG